MHRAGVNSCHVGCLQVYIDIVLGCQAGMYKIKCYKLVNRVFHKAEAPVPDAFVTYGANCKSATHSMCIASAPVDECHTLTQRDLRYTLFHFKKRVARSAITSMMCRLHEVHGINSASVFGYEAVSLGGIREIVENKTEQWQYALQKAK